MFSIHARTDFCSPEVSAVEESKEETAVAVAVAAAVMLPDKHSLHPTSHIWKSPHPGRGQPWTQACGAAAPQPDRYHHKQRAGPRQGLMRREGHTHRARRASRRQRQKEDKEKGASVGDAVVFCSVLLRIRPWFRRPRLPAMSVRKSYSHPGTVQRCAALP